MKKHLLIGLTILMGTNLVTLSGVAYNRMGEATAHLTLTERELSLPYNRGGQNENSGLSLSINWRIPIEKRESYYPYNSQDIKVTKDELFALGFEHFDAKNNYWVESKELYWVFEFNGVLFKAEIENATKKYQEALTLFDEAPNDENSRNKNEYSEILAREKSIESRLFFVEASNDYAPLFTKFSTQPNIIIVKGLAKPRFNRNNGYYSLTLSHLSLSNIMVPLDFSKILSDLRSENLGDISSPRYAVDVMWGSRLEPWIVDVKRLNLED